MSTVYSTPCAAKELMSAKPVELIVEDGNIEVDKINELAIKKLTLKNIKITSHVLELIVECRIISNLTFIDCQMDKEKYKFLSKSREIVVLKNCLINDKKAHSQRKIENLGFMNQFGTTERFNPDLFWQRGRWPKELRKQIDAPDLTAEIDGKISKQIKEQLAYADKLIEDAAYLYMERENVLAEPTINGSEAFRNFTAYAEAVSNMMSTVASLEKHIAMESDSENENAFLYSLKAMSEKLDLEIMLCQDAYNHYAEKNF